MTINKPSVNHSHQRGTSLIELIVAIAIFATVASGVVVLALGSYRSLLVADREIQLESSLNNSIYALEQIRNRSWEELAEGEYGLAFSSGNWTLVTVSEDSLLPPYSRTIGISAAQRDEQGRLIQSGGNIDEDTKHVIVEIVWTGPVGETTHSQELLFTNWQTSRGQLKLEANEPIQIDSCETYCLSIGYGTGVCRQNARQCEQNNETPEGGGDQFCPAGNQSDCCCI